VEETNVRPKDAAGQIFKSASLVARGLYFFIRLEYLRLMSSLLELVGLKWLMGKTRGRPEIALGLIDGPVDLDHPSLTRATIREIKGRSSSCDRIGSAACLHGTYIAGFFSGRRGSPAPALCPECTLVVRPIFPETVVGMDQMPSATPADLAEAILDCVAAGVRVLNLSVALSHPSAHGDRRLAEALDYAAQRGVITAAAAGNQGTLGSSVITRHPGVIPVVAYDALGRPLSYSNLGKSIGTRGVGAPGENITSLGPDQPLTLSGTSVAVPFVTGSIALLWSLFPAAPTALVKFALTRASGHRRPALVPALLNAWSAYKVLQQTYTI
jgi:subtilisin family serine protease